MTPEEARGLRATLEATGCLDDVLADALGTIADMCYEYAAQVEKNGERYIITDSTEGHWLCGDDHKVLQDWHSDYMDAEDYAYSWNKHDGERTGTTAHIVHRLVSEPEVVE